MSIKIALTATPNPVKFSPILYCGPVAAAFKKAAEYGYDGVEIHLRDVGDISVPELLKLKKDYKLDVTTLGTGIAAFEYGISFSDKDPAVRKRAVEHVKKFITVAGELGSAVTIGLMTGKAGKGEDRAARIEAAYECLAECRASAEKAGIMLLLEAINRYESDYIMLQEEAVTAAKKAGGAPIKILSDIYHMNIEEVYIVGTIRKFAKEIGYVHFADSNRHYIGEGHTDYAAVVKALKEVGYSGYISFECLPIPDPDTTAKTSIANLKKCL